MKQMHLFLMGLLLLCAVTVGAQTPPSFTYQAVATDNEGSELVDQAVGVRLGLRQGSPSGLLVWQETHATTTDPFGLFTLAVGTGAPSGGSAASFGEIPWNDGPYFLQVELDAQGGSSYVNMGTTQVHSVPFALYTERSNRADSAAVAGSAQTADFANSAAVAQQAEAAAFADSATIATTTYHADYAEFAQQADSAAVAGSAAFAQNAQVAENAINATNALNADMASYAQAAFIELMDEDRDSLNELQELSFDGDEISLTNGNAISLTSQSNYHAPGADLHFPEGLKGDTYLFIPDQYTIPDGKNFYIVAAEEEIRLPNFGEVFGMAKTGPHFPLIPQNTLVDNCRCVGLLIDRTEGIDPVIIVLAAEEGSAYTVPADRYLVIKSGVDDATGLTLNNLEVNFFDGPSPYLIIPGGITIRNTSDTEAIITGYLNN